MLSTSYKIKLARLASALLVLARRIVGLPSAVSVRRRGINWQLDLLEGVDLSIYLLGGFEVRTLRRYRELVKEGDVVLDIGANVGAHTLPLAELVGKSGRVIAFEPTAYAFKKMIRNIESNKPLAPRITARQMLLVEAETAAVPGAIYSSWPLEAADDLHEDHHGRLMETTGATASTLDAFLESAGVRRVDFIKIDVDGNELGVLRGARSTCKMFGPKLMIEFAPYVHADRPGEFDELVREISELGYELQDIATGRSLPSAATELRAIIPQGGGLNVLAFVSSSRRC